MQDYWTRSGFCGSNCMFFNPICSGLHSKTPPQVRTQQKPATNVVSRSILDTILIFCRCPFKAPQFNKLGTFKPSATLLLRNVRKSRVSVRNWGVNVRKPGFWAPKRPQKIWYAGQLKRPIFAFLVPRKHRWWSKTAAFDWKGTSVTENVSNLADFGRLAVFLGCIGAKTNNSVHVCQFFDNIVSNFAGLT